MSSSSSPLWSNDQEAPPSFRYRQLSDSGEDRNDSNDLQAAPRAVYIRTLHGVSRYHSYPARTSKTLGEAQIGIGVIAAILNAIGLGLQLNRNSPNVAFYVVTGFWGLIFFCLSGSFAIVAGKRKTTCPIVSHMVLAVFGAASGFVLAGQGAGGVAAEMMNAQYTGHLDPFDTHPEHHLYMASLVISIFVLLCGVLEFALCVWGSSLGCRTVCCGTEASSSLSRAMTSQAGEPMIVVNGQAQAILDDNCGHVMGLTTEPGTPLNQQEKY